MTESSSKLKLARGLPKPKPFTAEQLRQMKEEAKEARRVVEAAKRRIEMLTADDLRIRLR